jgi:hypothetical protein
MFMVYAPAAKLFSGFEIFPAVAVRNNFAILPVCVDQEKLYQEKSCIQANFN